VVKAQSSPVARNRWYRPAMPWTDDLEVFCADIGSLAKGKFAWACRLPAAADEEVHAPASIDSLVTAVTYRLERGTPVALGFEMPLFAPVPLESGDLGKARPSDKDAPAWCSGIGASVLATGLVQVAWLLRRLHERVAAVPVHFRWDRFADRQSGLLLWEAFVTAGAKGETDEEDAAIGVEAFCAQLPTPGDADADETERPISFIAALAQWAGWDVDRDDFRSACVLVRAKAPQLAAGREGLVAD
jgi:hypothetical protein